MISLIQRRTWHWPMRIWMPLSNISIIGSGSMAPPYTPLTESVPPRRTVLIESSRALSRSTPNCSAAFSPRAPGSREATSCPIFATGLPWASIPTASTTLSGPRPAV